MRKLLAELGIERGTGIDRLIDHAWSIHSNLEPTTDRVGAFPLLGAATTLDKHVMEALTENGLDRDAWTNMLRLNGPAQPPPDDYAVHAEVEHALQWYRDEYGSRPLDIPGFAVALLSVLEPDLAYQQSGLKLEPATNALRQLIEFDRDDLVPVEKIESLDLSPTARSLVVSARALGGEYGAPLTTSTLILAILMTAGGDDTLLGAIRREIAGDTPDDELQKRITEWMIWYRAYEPRVQYATLTTADAFARAIELASVSSGKAVAHARHVLAALLTVPGGTPGMADVLRWMGTSAPPLRRTLMSNVEGFVHGGTIADDLDVWREFLFGRSRSAGPAHTLASVNIEETQGTDLLDFERDTKSFATLIAANTFTPPLSVGLFGNWGSGKSFFMEQLQKEIAALAAEADKAGFATSFCTRIVQIKFNAWHYVEGNLWASLVEHIFRNLRLSADEPADVTNERRTFYLSQLDHAIAEKSAAEATIVAATKESEILTKRLEEETRAAESATANFTETARLAARDLIHLSDDEKAIVQTAMKDLGLSELPAAASQAADSVEQLRQVGTRTQQLFTWTLHGPGKLTRLLLFAAAVFSGSLLAFLLWQLARADWARALAGIVPFLGTFTACATWIVKQAKPVLAEVERARGVVDAAWQKAETKKKQDLEALDQQKGRAIAAAEEARTQLAAADRKRLDAEKALEKLGEDRKLVRFIDERIASDDYRKYLGVLALVRGDFESLTRFMSDTAVAAADGPHRIDRIVLYIDDLDRCPPRYVRDVLQAVHLLLAFKLFVVVVGVDARWVSRSLEREYRDQLRPEKTKAGANSLAGYGASAYDYLEKIFQVPFWIEPLTEDATRKLLTGIVKVRAENPEPQPSDPNPAPSAAPAPTVPRTAVNETPPPQPAAAPQEKPKSPLAGDHRLKPALLELEPAELQAMHHLAPLIGRSPRSVKRFANIYRIIRASKKPDELTAFVGQGNGRGDYENVLLVLGIITGAPTVSTEMLEELRQADEGETLTAFSDRVKPSPPRRDREAAAEWTRACEAISLFGKRIPAATTGDLQPHLRPISRYSFREPIA